MTKQCSIVQMDGRTFLRCFRLLRSISSQSCSTFPYLPTAPWRMRVRSAPRMSGSQALRCQRRVYAFPIASAPDDCVARPHGGRVAHAVDLLQTYRAHGTERTGPDRRRKVAPTTRVAPVALLQPTLHVAQVDHAAVHLLLRGSQPKEYTLTH